MKLGDVLKKERARRRLSPKAMAQLLGISEDGYQAIEAGRKFDLPPDKLLEWGERLLIGFQELDDYP